MTVGKFIEILKDNDIPDDAEIQADTGWECSAVPFGDVWYYRTKNIVCLTQHSSGRKIEPTLDGKQDPPGSWELIYEDEDEHDD